MEYYFAPMEGVTGALYRRIHHKYFPGVDAYYMPFLTPTRDRVFTPRDLRETAPEHNLGFRAVPQLLTRDSGDFCWAANALFDMGYDEVNLNLGCPSGTVVAKGKGTGLLADRSTLEARLDGIFAGARGPVSVKTRLGLESPEEFGPLLELFARYPISLLIVHPRVRKDFYKEPVRRKEFALAHRDYPGPLCYNGGLFTPEDCEALLRDYPRVQSGAAAKPRPHPSGQGRPASHRGGAPGLPRRALSQLPGCLPQRAQYHLPHEGAVELPGHPV